ncbi:AraC family transcriptional regulator [Aerococcaceae bacterium DSM 109653]|uniref:AraC family transcriptional regulator n=1 Tax=Fundicoccus ignavus TaxID=2664442 RepID=A0A844BRX5_9LACT|nr:AraC family transcriptional regulator [Fundicoccus ignavus]MRI80832.1 AraC family transcriptional regulator [Fundicoccus ignavus]
MKTNDSTMEIQNASKSAPNFQKIYKAPLSEKQHFFENYAPSELTESYRIISTPSAFAKDTLFYIQEIGKLKSLKSHTSKREALDSYLFIIVVSGSGTFTYKGKTYTLSSGDHLFIDCKKPYSHKSTDSDPWELMWVHFNGALMDQYYVYFSSKNSSIVFCPNESSEFNAILEELMILVNKKSTHSELLASHLLNFLVTKILTNNTDQYTNDVDTIADKIQQIKQFLDENFQKKIPLDMIADEFFISKYHMSREFKKAYGITIANYIIAKRITHAKELLRFTDMQIEEIGRFCGIEDNSYFNKVFRKYEGMTASQYRTKWRGMK